MIDTSYISTLEDYEVKDVHGIQVHFVGQFAIFETYHAGMRIQLRIEYQEKTEHENAHFAVYTSNMDICMVVTKNVAPDFFRRKALHDYAWIILDSLDMVTRLINIERTQRINSWNLYS